MQRVRVNERPCGSWGHCMVRCVRARQPVSAEQAADISLAAATALESTESGHETPAGWPTGCRYIPISASVRYRYCVNVCNCHTSAGIHPRHMILCQLLCLHAVLLSCLRFYKSRSWLAVVSLNRTRGHWTETANATRPTAAAATTTTNFIIIIIIINSLLRQTAAKQYTNKHENEIHK